MQTPQWLSTEMQASTPSDIRLAGPECLPVTHLHPSETYNTSSSSTTTPTTTTSPSTIDSIYNLYNPEEDHSKPYEILADLDMITLLHNTPSVTCSPAAPSPCHTPPIERTSGLTSMLKASYPWHRSPSMVDVADVPISRRLAPTSASPVKSTAAWQAQQYLHKGSKPRTTLPNANSKSRPLRQLMPSESKFAGTKRRAEDSRPFLRNPRKKEDAYERFKKQRTMFDVNGKETACGAGVQAASKDPVKLLSPVQEPETDLPEQFINDLGYDPSTLPSWTLSSMSG
ncbi:hypothetical protein EVG20_g2489 [Dentipellis fragilis]|uniref:Uncharacterized protein n=1 Tax=Dentipellis fragilis TaxID=205917 RepID=A0A4Y9Z9K4_9AGAM|nr:hypothetical protein EVG20_g2489 [Dentipellis fragilis]